MPLKATSSRRQIIVGLLFGLAFVGGALRYWAPDPSLTRDIGSLLLVLWLPVIGNVIAFVVNKVRGRVAASPFSAPFTPQLLVEITPFSPQLRASLGRLEPNEDRCTIVVGTDGFSARTSQPLARWLAQLQAQTVELEFLRPGLALPRFAGATAFRVLAGTTVVAEGRVLQVLA